MNRRTNRRLVLCSLIGFFLIANSAITWLLWNVSYSDAMETTAFFLSGCLVAEICLLAIWGAQGDQHAKYRIPLTLVLGLVVACSYIGSIRFCDDSFPLDVALVMFGIAAAVYGCSLVPMWIMRWLTQHRIAVPGETKERSEEGSAQFGLRYLLMSPVVLAGVMILLQYSLPKERDWAGGAAEIFFGVAVMVVFTTLICIPCVWLALAERRRWPWAVWLAVVCIGGPLLVIAIFNSVYGSPGDIWDALRPIGSFTYGLAMTLLGVLLVIRLLGYRLVRPAGACPFKLEEAEVVEKVEPRIEPSNAKTTGISHRFRLTVLGVMAGILLIANAVAMVTFTRMDHTDTVETIVIVLAASQSAEVCLFAIAGALGGGHAKYRLPLTLLLSFGAASGYVIAMSLDWGGGMPLDFVLLLLGVAAGLYVATLVPMSIMRLVTRRRIAVPELLRTSPPLQGTAQFGLRYLLVSPVVLIGVILLLQFLLPPLSTWDGQIMEILFGAVVFVVFSTLICMPSVWLALAERRRWPWALSLAIICLGGPLAAVALCSAYYGGLSDRDEAFWTAVKLVLGGIAALLLPLLVARRLGYRLVRPGGACPFGTEAVETAEAVESGDPFAPSQAAD